MAYHFDRQRFSKDLRAHRHQQRLSSNRTLRGSAALAGVNYAMLNRFEQCTCTDLYGFAKLCRWMGKPMEAYFTA